MKRLTGFNKLDIRSTRLTSLLGLITLTKLTPCPKGAYQPADEEPGGRAAEVVGRDEARLEQVLQGERRLPGGS